MKEKGNLSERPANIPEQFVCTRCAARVDGKAIGTAHRNHCPRCLWSRHVDDLSGDRRSTCGGMMEPVAIWVRKGEWVIIRRCQECGALHANRIAGDDNELALVSIAVRPVAQPPFPLDCLARLADTYEAKNEK